MTTPPTTPRAEPGRCPKCRGRLGRGRDIYGAYLSCLMCGYSYELTSRAAIDLADMPDPREAESPADDGTAPS